MKISIITACLNNVATIENTIQSVISQDFNDIEYIILDGLSTDGTLEIINKYRNKISVISEKDNGIYYALNKGLAMAKGAVTGILHADDFYATHDVITKVAFAFSTSGADAVYGNLQYVKRDDTTKMLRNWISKSYHEGLFLEGWMPPHPAFFIKKKCYDDYGYFNTSLTVAADYELMLRMIHKYKISVYYLPELLVKMRSGGVSNKTLFHRIRANMEDRKAWRINNLKPHFTTLWKKPFGKIVQYYI